MHEQHEVNADGRQFILTIKNRDLMKARDWIQKSIDVNYVDPVYGTALMQACRLGFFNMIELLLTCGSELKLNLIHPGLNLTAMDLAYTGKDESIITLLNMKGALEYGEGTHDGTYVEENQIDYSKIYASGGGGSGNEYFAFFRCPLCDWIHLYDQEYDEFYPNPDNLTERITLSPGQALPCRKCTGKIVIDRCIYGPRAVNKFRAGWSLMNKSKWKKYCSPQFSKST